ncbi:unnamed protein product [Closterium sp. NIES-53]
MPLCKQLCPPISVPCPWLVAADRRGAWLARAAGESDGCVAIGRRDAADAQGTTQAGLRSRAGTSPPLPCSFHALPRHVSLPHPLRAPHPLPLPLPLWPFPFTSPLAPFPLHLLLLVPMHPFLNPILQIYPVFLLPPSRLNAPPPLLALQASPSSPHHPLPLGPDLPPIPSPWSAPYPSALPCRLPSPCPSTRAEQAAWVAQCEAEVELLLDVLVWRFSIWADRPLPGCALMNLRFRDERAAGVGPGVGTGIRQPVVNFALCLTNEFLQLWSTPLFIERGLHKLVPPLNVPLCLSCLFPVTLILCSPSKTLSLRPFPLAFPPGPFPTKSHFPTEPLVDSETESAA